MKEGKKTKPKRETAKREKANKKTKPKRKTGRERAK